MEGSQSDENENKTGGNRDEGIESIEMY